MEKVTKEDLLQLIHHDQGPCVSIYMPTHRIGEETKQDPIRLRNLLRAASEQLVSIGFRRPEAGDLLAEANKLFANDSFWMHQGEGLAVFIAPGFFRYFREPYNYAEMLSVAERFHIKPLLQAFSGNGEFYVLALSQKQAKLHEATRDGMNEIPTPDVPQGVAEALKYDQPEEQLQFHTRAPRHQGSKREAIFHGHGVGIDDTKENALRYSQIVDKTLQKYLKQKKNQPMVLAGVNSLLSIFREANTYPNVISNAVIGNAEALRPKELHTKAWSAITSHLEGQKGELIEQISEMVGNDRASAEGQKIVAAAYGGRVDKLIISNRNQMLGKFDASTMQVSVNDTPQPGDIDLLDLAAVHTLRHNGGVYLIDAEHVLGASPIAALFRYDI